MADIILHRKHRKVWSAKDQHKITILLQASYDEDNKIGSYFNR